MSQFAPIALFVYKRPTHAMNAVRSLMSCPEFNESPFFVFCDGPKPQSNDNDRAKIRETREAIRAIAPQASVFIERETNLGLAQSIIHGVAQLCDQFGRVIVVEDDLEVGPGFLSFMNRALEKYRDVEAVYQVSGYQFPVDLSDKAESVFLNFPTSWGWATWKRAWANFDPKGEGFDELVADAKIRKEFDLNGSYPYFEMLGSQLKGKIDSWAIRWYLTCFKAKALTLYPPRSLVQNKGMDGSGTHGDSTTAFSVSLETNFIDRFPIETVINRSAQRKVENYLSRVTSTGLRSRAKKFLERFFR